MPDIIWTILEEMNTDHENESEILIDFYNGGDEQRKEIVDLVLLMICGWKMDSLIQIARRRGNLIEGE